MTVRIENDDKTLASVQVRPKLSDEYLKRYKALIRNLGQTLPINRKIIIENEISFVKNTENNNDLECLKYLAALHVLIDLSQQGWIFDIESDELELRIEDHDLNDKDIIRYRMSAERNAQFRNDSVAKFIERMETGRQHNGRIVSIKDLIGDPDRIIEFIKQGSTVCDPYIQEATRERDKYTGFYLSDIWRYFRYTWSIPYKTMPGRNMFYLVRDRAQLYHPIIGIFALGNSVLNLTVRDDDIGWTVYSIKKNLERKAEKTRCEQIVGGTNGKTIKVCNRKPLETKDECDKRRSAYAEMIMPLLESNLQRSIDEIYTKDLNYHKQTKYPKQETIDDLLQISNEFSAKSLNNKNNVKTPNWLDEAKSNLFVRKRAEELAKLLVAKREFNSANGTCLERLEHLLSYPLPVSDPCPRRSRWIPE